MLNRQLQRSPSLLKGSIFNRPQCSYSQWAGPKESQKIHPSDIIAVLLKDQDLESGCNTYMNLTDHLSGAGYGSTIAKAMSSQSGVADNTLQRRYNFHYRVALAFKFPQLFEYAKLYKATQKDLSKNISHDTQIAAHHLLVNNQLPQSDNEIPKQIEDSSREIMHGVINQQLRQQIEEIFGKEIEIGSFTDEEIFKINLKANQMINHDIDMLHFKAEASFSPSRPEL